MCLQFADQKFEDSEFAKVRHMIDYAAALDIDTTCALGFSEDLEEESLVTIKEALQAAIEAANKAAVIDMGRCPVGFAWRREGAGYRCEGGSHYVTDEEIKRARKNQ